MVYKQISISTQLTLIRLIVSPFVLPFFLVYLLPYNNIYVNGCMAIFFVLLSATDFFDGFFARKFGTVTLFGAALDPLADKFLLYSTIISLLAAGKVHFLWAIVWIGREFFVMGIRQIALEHRLSIAVSFLAKMKTFAQDCALAVIIFNPYQHFGFEMLRWNGLELSLLLIATIFSVVSAQRYCKIFLQQCKNLEWL